MSQTLVKIQFKKTWETKLFADPQLKTTKYVGSMCYVNTLQFGLQFIMIEQTDNMKRIF